jgi:prepilin-type N-terminal cleavage/methylation domain-containing protein
VTAPTTPRDAGVTLIEVLVAMALFGVVGTLLLGFAVSTSRVTDQTRSMTMVSEETRLAMERLTRELRQASQVLHVDLPSASGGATALTFWTDFNGNGMQDLDAADPEVLTYRWTPTTHRLTLTANDASGTATTLPVLAAAVSDFGLDLRSSAWQHDADGDGVTTWREVDAAVGNRNGVADSTELRQLDLVAVSITATDGTHEQSYRTQVDLRNRMVN